MLYPFILRVFMKMYYISWDLKIIEAEVTLISERQFNSVVDRKLTRYESTPEKHGFYPKIEDAVNKLVENQQARVEDLKLELRLQEEELSNIIRKYSNENLTANNLYF